MTSPRNANPTLLIGLVVLLCFFIGMRTHSALFLIISGAMVVVLYQRFRKNYLENKQKLQKQVRRHTSIDVESDEIKDTELPVDHD